MIELKPYKLYGLYDIDIDKLENQSDKDLYNPKHRYGQFEISEDLKELDKYNCWDYYGIFQTVNEYNGARLAENIYKINYWFCDIDKDKAGCTKKEMLLSLAQCKKRPTFIIETKNGFHCYWKAKDATKENWKKIESGLVKKFKADPARTDMNGLLRYPYSIHWKIPTDPYCIRYLYEDAQNEYWDFNPENPDSKYKLYGRSDNEYTESEMLLYFAKPETKKQVLKTNKKYSSETPDFMNESKWDSLFDLKNWGVGNRNSNFARIVLWMKEYIDNIDIAYVVRTINDKYLFPSLPQSEITSLLRGKGIYD